jgi:hypothetical protein
MTNALSTRCCRPASAAYTSAAAALLAHPPGRSRPTGLGRLMSIADYPGLNDTTGQAIDELANQGANPSRICLDYAEAVSVGRGAWA